MPCVNLALIPLLAEGVGINNDAALGLDQDVSVAGSLDSRAVVASRSQPSILPDFYNAYTFGNESPPAPPTPCLVR